VEPIVAIQEGDKVLIHYWPPITGFTRKLIEDSPMITREGDVIEVAVTNGHARYRVTEDDPWTPYVVAELL
jgi:hypothetical protein